MARILMLGAFGQRNVGDEALCASLCDAFCDHDLIVASTDPTLTTALHGCAAVPARPLDVAREVRHADVVLVGGGTVLKTLHPSAGRRPHALLINTAGLVTLARWSSTPVAFVGVGADQLRGGTAQRWARRIARDASLLVLRDEESAAVLTDAGVTPPFWIGGDIAWRLFRAGRPDRHRRVDGRPRATVALSHLAGGPSNDLPERLGAALAELAADGWELALQPWQAGPRDLEVADRIRRLAPSARLVEMPTDLVAAAHHFADDDLVVAMRFHALVAAGAAGTRSVAIAHEPKLAGLARRLDQIAVAPDASVPILASALRWGADHRAPSDQAVRHEIELADHSLRLAALLVEGGRLDHPEHLPALELSDGGGRW
ncbi:MAG: polysaccharide pyruvyl transferase family protein [Acidimicrobiia bacterium]